MCALPGECGEQISADLVEVRLGRHFTLSTFEARPVSAESAARFTRVATLRPSGSPPIPLSQLTDPSVRLERGMFIPPPGTNAAAAERAQQQSRGYVLGIILLVLFLSSQDFSPPARRHGVEAARDIREGMSKHREDVKEKVRSRTRPSRAQP